MNEPFKLNPQLPKRTSVSLHKCLERGHDPSRVSHNGFDLVIECPRCYACWLVQGITGDEMRLSDSYAFATFGPKLPYQKIVAIGEKL